MEGRVVRDPQGLVEPAHGRRDAPSLQRSIRSREQYLLVARELVEGDEVRPEAAHDPGAVRDGPYSGEDQVLGQPSDVC